MTCQRTCRRAPHAMYLLIILSVTAIAADGYEFPPARRGDITARLAVLVAEPKIGVAPAATLTVTVEGGQTLEVEPVRLDDSTEGWQVTRHMTKDSHATRLTVRQVLNLRQTKPGLIPLPGVNVRFREGPAAEWQEAEWVNLLRDAAEVAPPDAVEITGNDRSAWLVCAIVIVAGIAGFVIWLRRTSNPPPVLSPAKRALTELDVLEQQGLERGEVYQRLSDLVRGFLTERLQLPAQRLTTPEILQEHIERVPPDSRVPLAKLLERCDLVKFARTEASALDCREALVLARTVIRSCDENGAAVGATIIARAAQ